MAGPDAVPSGDLTTGGHLIMWKAKMFGVHTPMYGLAEEVLIGDALEVPCCVLLEVPTARAGCRVISRRTVFERAAADPHPLQMRRFWCRRRRIVDRLLTAPAYERS